MIRMTNNQLFSRRRVLVTGLASGALLSVPAIAGAAPRDAEPGIGPELELQAVRFELPPPTGREHIGTTDLHLVDPARRDRSAPSGKRELMVSVYYPADRSGQDGPVAKYLPPKTAAFVDQVWSKTLGVPAGTFDFANTRTHASVGAGVQPTKHPVVLFSPGYSFSRFLATAQAEDLASRGYIVVTIDHTHETPVEFPGGRFVAGTRVDPTPDSYRWTIATRTADARFVLNQIGRIAAGANPDSEHRPLPAGIRDAIDLRKVGMAGFSAGGLTTANTMLLDSRITAGADLDGTLAYDFANGPLSEVAKQGLDRPFLLFGSDGSQRTDPGNEKNYDKSWAGFWQAQRGWKLNLQLPGSQPKSFTDLQFIVPQMMSAVLGDNPDGPKLVDTLVGHVDPDRSILAQRSYLAAFLDQFVKGRPQSLLRKESTKFPEIRFAG
jgi:dienelactone hydrolase